MKLFAHLVIFLFCSLTVLGQKNFSLSGKIMDADNSAVVAGNVELLAAKDSSFVSGTNSDANGIFSLKELESAKYILRITYLGYKPLLKNITLDGSKIETYLGVLTIEPDAILLREAIVDGKRPEVVVKGDTLEYDATTIKVAENSVVEDLLKKTAGVEVDKDGNITAGGKSVKRVYVNGKEFFNDDPLTATKNLPAEMVEKIQVYERKSDMAQLTGFNDGEEETVINLTVRPGMAQGTMGNAQLGAGSSLDGKNDFRYNGSGFLNQQKDANRLTFIIGGNNNNNMGGADMIGGGGGGGIGGGAFGGRSGISKSQNYAANINREFSPALKINGDVRYGIQERYLESTATDMTTISDKDSQLDKTESTSNNSFHNISANMRIDWKPDTLNTFIFRPNVSLRTSDSNSSGLAARYDYNTLDTIYDSYTSSFNDGSTLSFGGSLDFAHKFSKPGRVFTLTARGNFSDGNTDRISLTNYTAGDTVFYKDRNQRTFNDNITNNYTFTGSWVEPLGNNFFAQATYRLTHSETESLNSTYDILENDPYLMATVLKDTALINLTQSRSTVRNSTNQRIGLNLQMMREKFRLTAGFNVDPSKSVNETFQPLPGQIGMQLFNPADDARLAVIRGDSLVSRVDQNIVNFSPIINFNYTFGQRTNLRVDYEGETNQPSANQLRDILDDSNPTNWNQGNPNLKPGYSNSLRLQFQKYVPETQLMYMLMANGSFSLNDIVSVTKIQPGGIRLTTYENINGNWNSMLMGMFNTPLKDKRFSINNMIMGSYSHSNSYVNELKNLGKSASINDNLRFNYSSDLFYFSINGNINFSNITYTANPESNLKTTNYGLGANTTWYLPKKWTVDSDINWTVRKGYAEEYNIPQTLWNASVTKELFNKKFGTGSIRVQIFDILKNRNSISATTTTNGFSTSQSLVLPSYYMVSLIYRFSAFPSMDNRNNMFPGGFPSPGGRGVFPGSGRSGGSGGSGGSGRVRF
ncbi:MAG: outer membrane beta-barrel protein [Candidatus Symbiothrix sp.]|jgi:outer membrane receptor protein involved in Fe transport|nr:outer membrane beta-barrel protein [Candidatus Symbiothrix sp.]